MNILEVEGLSKEYDNHLALDQLSINVPRGAIFGLLGPNGAGKTSLIRIITEILDATTGSIKINGEVLSPNHLNHIGYLPEERGLYRKMYVREHLEYIADLRNLSRSDAKLKIDAWIERFNLGKWQKSEIGSLSKGMQQKVQFIATILHDPELIILDEPFSGFDPVNQQLLTNEIKQLNKDGKTIIFSTHRMESVEEICTHIALINQSKCVLQGELKHIQNQFATEESIVTYSKNGDEISKTIPSQEVKNSIADLKPNEELVSILPKRLSIKDIFISIVNESN